jgi:hypothetical protein
MLPDSAWSCRNFDAAQDFTPGGNSGVTTPQYDMQPYSSIVLVSKPE